MSPAQKGILFALIGYTCFSFSDLNSRWLSQNLPIFQIIFFQGLFSCAILLLFQKMMGGWQGLKDRNEIKIHALRSVLNIAILFLLIHTYSIMPVAQAYSMVFTKPFMVAILAMIVYGERVSHHSWLAIVIGFAGVLICLRPDAGFNLDLLFPLGGTLAIALMFLISRSLQKASPLVLSFYPIAASVLATLPFVVMNLEPMQLLEIGLLSINGCLIVVGLTSVSIAYRDAKASIVGPFIYTQMIWALIFGYLIFGDETSWPMLAGTMLIIASGFYILRKESA